MKTLTEQDLLQLCHENKCNVDIVTGYTAEGVFAYAVRLRPWKQNARQPVMVMAQGKSIQEALDNATQMAATARWSALDWAGRPWATRSLGTGTWADDASGATAR